MRIAIASITAALISGAAAATSPPPSGYAGEQHREILTLSADDLAELRRGGGSGLARAAELNGVPGPAHLLEMADEIGLDAGQIAAIAELHGEMQADAIAAGARLIAAERALDEAFSRSLPDAAALAALVSEAGEARAALRLVHLTAHLHTPGLLTNAQIDRYARLRGYRGDPCASVPAGHDAALWRRHNGCG